MATSKLCLHRGARIVSYDELQAVDPPAPTETFFPLKHQAVFDRVVGTMVDSGYEVAKQSLALSPDNHRFFATVDLRTEIMDGIALVVGIRNGTDRSTAISFCAGERCFICDNMAFSSDVVIARRHTRFGERRFNDALSRAVVGLHQYQALAQKRIETLRDTVLSEDAANSYLLQAAERGIVGWRLLPKVIEEYRNPQHEAFKNSSKWALFNAFTEVLKDRQLTQPARAASETIRLQQLLLQGPVIDVPPVEEALATAG